MLCDTKVFLKYKEKNFPEIRNLKTYVFVNEYSWVFFYFTCNAFCASNHIINHIINHTI